MSDEAIVINYEYSLRADNATKICERMGITNCIRVGLEFMVCRTPPNWSYSNSELQMEIFKEPLIKKAYITRHVCFEGVSYSMKSKFPNIFTSTSFPESRGCLSVSQFFEEYEKNEDFRTLIDNLNSLKNEDFRTLIDSVKSLTNEDFRTLIDSLNSWRFNYPDGRIMFDFVYNPNIQ